MAKRNGRGTNQHKTQPPSGGPARKRGGSRRKARMAALRASQAFTVEAMRRGGMPTAGHVAAAAVEDEIRKTKFSDHDEEVRSEVETIVEAEADRATQAWVDDVCNAAHLKTYYSLDDAGILTDEWSGLGIHNLPQRDTANDPDWWNTLRVRNYRSDRDRENLASTSPPPPSASDRVQ